MALKPFQRGPVHYNRIQNALIQERIHDALGVKTPGTGSPSMGLEVHPVVIVGDFDRTDIAGRSQRFCMGGSAGVVTAGNTFLRWSFRNPLGSAVMLKLVSLRFQTDVGSAGVLATALGPLNADVQVGGGILEHTQPNIPVQTCQGQIGAATGAAVLPFPAGSIAMQSFLIANSQSGSAVPPEVRPQDMWIAPGLALYLNNDTAFGVAAKWFILAEWMEQAIPGQ